MEKERFIKTLTEAGVPEEIHDIWWNKWLNDPVVLKLKPSEECLKFFAEKNMEKGCITSAPW